jgi:hypothetical protein
MCIVALQVLRKLQLAITIYYMTGIVGENNYDDIFILLVWPSLLLCQ